MKRHKTLPATHIFSLCQFRALKLCKLGHVTSTGLKELVLETATLFRVFSIILPVA